MVADLKGELLHATRQLTQARQQVRASEETCGELRERCQGLEVEKQTLTLELQDAQERLQARQSRLDDHRRDAADAKLRVVSLTAERDELANKVQEAWDHIANLNAVLRTRDEEVARMEAEVRSTRHAADLVVQQRTTMESELRLLQTTVKESSEDRHADAVASGRLTTSLQTAVQRVADVLCRAACDYQQSVVEGGEWVPSLLTAFATHHRAERGGGGNGGSSGGPPHVVLSPASLPAIAHTPRGTSAESARLQAESLLHNAEALVWEEAADAPATPASKHPHALVEPRHEASVSQEPVVHAALAPLLLAMKQVAAMLSTVRHAQSRVTAEAAHYRARYEEVQGQLEAVQRSVSLRETEDSAARLRTRHLQQQVEAVEAKLRQCKQDDTQRRAALAAVLRCREDWALIQHSVERLLVRHGELQKDMAQLQRAPGWGGAEGTAAAAEGDDDERLRAQPPPPQHGGERAEESSASSSARPAASPARLEAAQQPLTSTALVDTPRSQWRADGQHDGAVDAHSGQDALATPPASSQSANDLNRAASRVYPAPLPAAKTFTASSAIPSAAERERVLLHSLYGSAQRTSPPPPPPLPTPPSATPDRLSSGAFRREVSSSSSINGGGLDQSSMFAVEVLQVIEALDRRVSGALHRAQRS